MSNEEKKVLTEAEAVEEAVTETAAAEENALNSEVPAFEETVAEEIAEAAEDAEEEDSGMIVIMEDFDELDEEKYPEDTRSYEVKEASGDGAVKSRKKAGAAGVRSGLFTVLLSVLSFAWLYPIIMILINSLKKETAISTNTAFDLPSADTFAGLDNFVNAIGSKGFVEAFLTSVLITVTSVIAILVFCSMCAWYITRVENFFTKIVYFLFIFSMVVPFQMLMFTLAATSDQLNLNTPWNIWVIYLGFGAGLAVFMFSGFVKSIPIEIEEAAMIDGCNPLQTFFMIVLPVLKPTLISVGILETMWVWNDYLLPYLVLDRKEYTTVPILIQYFKGSFGRVEMGPMMACIMLTVLPVIIIYLICQKHIIKGVVAGAVKG